VSTHSDNRENLLTITPESVLTMRRNRCSRSFRMSAHDGAEYAEARGLELPPLNEMQ
jgi:hypothetical protein